MRDYARLRNLERAAGYGLLIAAMSYPRLYSTGHDVSVYMPAAFLAMTLVSAAATAWGGKNGLRGLFPRRNLMAKGLMLAMVLGMAALLLKVYFADPLLKQILPDNLARLSFPTTTLGVFGVILWSAGFENMFFNIASTSYFARLTRRVWAGLALAATFRVFVSSRVLTNAGVDSPPLLAFSAAYCLIASFLFARFGLPAATLFVAISSASVAF